MGPEAVPDPDAGPLGHSEAAAVSLRTFVASVHDARAATCVLAGYSVEPGIALDRLDRV